MSITEQVNKGKGRGKEKEKGEEEERRQEWVEKKTTKNVERRD